MDEDYQVYISDVDRLIQSMEVTSDHEMETALLPEKILKESNDQSIAPLEIKPLIADEQRLWTKLVKPPDINYRFTIETDQENMDTLFKDKSMHFEEKCLEYEVADNMVLSHILQVYLDWIGVKWAELDHDMYDRWDPKWRFYNGLISLVFKDMDIAEEEQDRSFERARAWGKNKGLSAPSLPADTDDESTAGLAASGATNEAHSESESAGYETANEDAASSASESL